MAPKVTDRLWLGIVQPSSKPPSDAPMSWPWVAAIVAAFVVGPLIWWLFSH